MNKREIEREREKERKRESCIASDMMYNNSLVTTKWGYQQITNRKMDGIKSK